MIKQFFVKFYLKYTIKNGVTQIVLFQKNVPSVVIFQEIQINDED